MVCLLFQSAGGQVNSVDISIASIDHRTIRVQASSIGIPVNKGPGMIASLFLSQILDRACLEPKNCDIPNGPCFLACMTAPTILHRATPIEIEFSSTGRKPPGSHAPSTGATSHPDT